MDSTWAIWALVGIVIGAYFALHTKQAQPPVRVAKAAPKVFSCDYGKPLNGAVVRVIGDSHVVRQSPNARGKPLLNAKASETLGRIHYHVIDSSTRVELQCESGEWVRVRIIQPTWLNHVQGWVESYSVGRVHPLGEVRPIEAGDVLWDERSRPYRKELLRFLNKLQTEQAICADAVDLSSLAESPTTGTSTNPVFFVWCGQAPAAERFEFQID